MAAKAMKAANAERIEIQVPVEENKQENTRYESDDDRVNFYQKINLLNEQHDCIPAEGDPNKCLICEKLILSFVPLTEYPSVSIT